MVDMKHKTSIGGLLLLAGAVAGAQVASHAPTVLQQAPVQGRPNAAGMAVEKPVARVNGAVLTNADLVREEYAIFPYARQHNGLPKDLASQIHDGALKMLVFEELVYQEAMRRNMTISAVKMQHSEADFRKQFTSPDEFNAFLQSDFHGSTQLLEEKIRRSLLIEAFLKTEVDNKSVMTAAEVRAYYDQNPVRFQHPESYTFQTISVLPPANATAEQLKEGHKRIADGLIKAKATKTAEEFGMLAEKISDDDYRVVMGQHKPVPVDQLAPEVVKALRLMHVGDVSGVIQLDQAYTIVRLGAHSPAGKAKFTDVQAALTKELQQTKKNQVRMALDKKLRQNAKVDEF
jgi:peptidyl-prolyl cis-trans isomerase SurA